ncbi:hypothetical protein GUITHDRAFT_146690 [Guillardia theta CCMP2712]|uniref:Uncharacterized protein n=1 Tax=Guillardia theta (strain CCMP2712) TaxID=905079 RepID=L1IG19_GUITC|nr:hypothetical protein GUITHDRAFT_146690 [Guillardia theta CCMP2712]EKX35193.1 hypothetical protein GUITHDRAFT_146690 [Guillardia theta CCMP2712]|eukprot:XP_005822173.1 hypothetical protein GUITHDRAFT_146690 [Guillardia theta CCMP2712]
MQDAGVYDRYPKDWDMTIPSMGKWLDTKVSERLEGAFHKVLGPFREYRVVALTEFHNQQHAEEWRIYIQSLRGLYEKAMRMKINPAVNLHSNLSQYNLPSWMQQTGVFSSNNLNDYGLPNTTWFEGYNIGGSGAVGIDVIALEVRHAQAYKPDQRCPCTNILFCIQTLGVKELSNNSRKRMSYILQSSGTFATDSIHKNFKNFENSSICETVNHVIESGTGHDFNIIEAKDLHTLIKSTVHSGGSNGNLTPLKMISSNEMKVSLPPPSGKSLSCDKQHLKQIMTPYNSLFDTLDELKNAVIDHISKIKEDWSKSGKNKMGSNLQNEGEVNIESKIPETLISGAMFTKLYSLATSKNGEGKDWDVKSQYGTYRLSAKAIAKMSTSTELDWSQHIENVKSWSRSLGKKGIDLVRHKMIAKNSKGDTYVIDNLYLPYSPEPNHSLAVISVDMGNLAGASSKKDVEDDSNLYSVFLSVPTEMFHKLHGSFRYELVRMHAPKVVEALGDVCNTHIRSQVYKGVLKMRPDSKMTESAKKLTAQQKGKWIKSASLLREYQKALETEMTEEERKLSNRFIDKALQTMSQKIKCIEGDMFKNISRGNYEIGSINSKYDMKFNFSHKVGDANASSYLQKELDLGLGNVWSLKSHCFIVY